MEIKIRPATVEDAPAIAKILRGLEWLARFQAEPAATTEQRIRNYLKLYVANNSHSAYVAEKLGGEVVGYTTVHWLPYLLLPGPEGYVSELFIPALERGRGIGTKLLEMVKQEAQARGCSRLMLLNMRNRESYQRGFYKKLGWEEREIAANFVLHLAKE
ncbi:MAG: GNAT family N-acetyltransferase [Anaerolineae bacterium]|nr:GNAT family N-acetyltransferase [Anaerolineae bacterium]